MLLRDQNALYAEFQSYALLSESIQLTETSNDGGYQISIRSTAFEHWVFNRDFIFPEMSPSEAEQNVAVNISNDSGCPPDQIDRRCKMSRTFPFVTDVPQPLPLELTLRSQMTTDEILSLLQVIYPDESSQLLSRISLGLGSPVVSRNEIHFEKKVLGYLSGKRLVATGTLFLFPERKIGWLGWALVHPEWRGRGLQRRLIEDRMHLAQGIDHLFCEVTPASPSERNLQALGFSRLFETKYLTKKNP